MFEQEIQYYRGRGAALVDGRSEISLSEILASVLLPDQLKTFFRAEAHWMLRELRAGSASQRFDYSRADVRAQLARLDELLIPTATFTSDEYSDTLEHGVKLTFNYLCRPQLTLRSFVFRGADSIGIDEALLRIGWFHDYAYFQDVLRPWLERKQRAGETVITADAFATTLAKIDEQVMQAMTVQDLHQFLQPMFRWIADAQSSATDRIATEAFVIFFDDKNINRVSEHLDSLSTRFPQLSTQQVCIIIEELIQSNDPNEIVESSESSESIVSTESTEIHESNGTYESHETYETPESNNLTDQLTETENSGDLQTAEPEISFSSPIDTATILDSPVEEPITEESIAEEQEEQIVSAPIAEEKPQPVPEPQRPATLGAMMSTSRYSDRNSEFKIVGARQAVPQTLSDLRSQIDDDSRKRYIKKLFRKNDPEYERAIDALNALQTWKEASAYIDFLFLRHGVDPYAKIAIQFTDAVYSRFVKVPSAGRT